MPAVALPVGLPPGVDPESAYTKSGGPGVRSGSGCTWTVDSGEVWLFQSVYCEVFFGAVKANATAAVSVLDEDNNTITENVAAASAVPAGTWAAGFTLGGAAPVFTPANGVAFSGSLPWLVLLPGTQLLMLFRPFAGGDVIGTLSQSFVTAWDYTGQAGGGGQRESLAPFLYVPGPGADV